MVSHYINKRAEQNQNKSEKMDPLMKAIKAFRTTIGTADVSDMSSLLHQRSSQEKFAKLIAPPVGISYRKDDMNNIPVEWACPEFAHRTDRVILYCHGGGYTCGGLGYASILSGKLAMHTGLEVLSFQYRLAPEDPYPAAIEDAVKIWNQLMYLGYGANDIIVAGDSAGGNLALELVLVLKAQKRMIPRALVLMSPWTDMTISSSSYDKYAEVDPMLTKEYVMSVRDAYAGNESDYRNPSLSPLYAELDNMPPTLIQVGSNEILRSDSELLHKKLRRNECKSILKVYSGCWHVFQQMPTPKASKALEDVQSFIQTL